MDLIGVRSPGGELAFPSLNEMKELPEKHLQPGQFTILLNNHQKLLTLGLLFGISEKQYRPIASQKLPAAEFHYQKAPGHVHLLQEALLLLLSTHHTCPRSTFFSCYTLGASDLHVNREAR